MQAFFTLSDVFWRYAEKKKIFHRFCFYICAMRIFLILILRARPLREAKHGMRRQNDTLAVHGAVQRYVG